MATVTGVNAYEYVDPLIAVVDPDVGCWDHAKTITIFGLGFADGAIVTFVTGAGTFASPSVTFVSENELRCTLPTTADYPAEDFVVDATTDVAVTNPDLAANTFPGGFEYEDQSWWAVPILAAGAVIGYDYVFSCEQPPDSTGSVTLPPRGWWRHETFLGAADIQGNIPRDVRSFDELGTFVTGAAAYLGGSPGCVANIDRRIVYPSRGYTVGTDNPPLYVFSGVSDRELVAIPPDASAAKSKVVLSMIAANGAIYLSVKDTTGGRVFQLDWLSGAITLLGAAFSVAPYALAWHMGRLWCGSNNGDGTAAKVFWFRPNIDSVWTEDHATSVETAGGVQSMRSFQGKLYVGCDAPDGVFAKVLVRSNDDTWTTSLTASGGTAKAMNGFPSMLEFGGNLYVGYWNNDTTPAALVKKYTGSAWSTAYTANVTATRRPYIGMFIENNVLYVLGGGLTLAASLIESVDGTTWTNLTAFLTGSSETVPAFGSVVL